MKMIKLLSIEEVKTHAHSLKELLYYCKVCSSGEILPESFFETKISELINYLNENKAYLFGAFEEESLVGFLWACELEGQDNKVLHVLYFAVSPNKQKQGLGKKLLMSAESLAKQRGIPEMELNVHKSNRSAYEFYVRNQYAEKLQTSVDGRIKMTKQVS